MASGQEGLARGLRGYGDGTSCRLWYLFAISANAQLRFTEFNMKFKQAEIGARRNNSKATAEYAN